MEAPTELFGIIKAPVPLGPKPFREKQDSWAQELGGRRHVKVPQSSVKGQGYAVVKEHFRRERIRPTSYQQLFQERALSLSPGILLQQQKLHKVRDLLRRALLR